MNTIREIARGALNVAIFLFFGHAGSAFGQDAEAEENTLYERLGGLPEISILLSDFVDDFVADPVIMANSAVRERKNEETVPYLKFQLTSLVCEVTGGPCQYTGLSLREAHEGLDVTEEEWERMVEILSQSLVEHGVAEREQEDFFAVLGPTREDIVVAGAQ